MYAGTAGIGLFLAELAAIVDDQSLRRTARGAIGHALDHLERVSPVERLGFHSGETGIACAAARVGILLEEPGLIASAADTLPRGEGPEPPRCSFDLTSGVAGEIAGLLLLASWLDRPDLLDRASRRGDALVSAGNADGAAVSWSPPDSRRQRDPRGFAHGAAGVGYALLELFDATREDRHRDAAERAFCYERGRLDERRRVWPDHRTSPHRSPVTSMATHGYWCNGAPGIALTRLRAWELLGEEVLKEEALTTLALTRDDVNAALAREREDFSLCHGMAGSADVLLSGAAVLGGGDDLSLALTVAREGVNRHARPGGSWPCGVPSGETPSLFLGLSGMGWFYLRAYDPQVPSPLVVHRA